MYKNIVNQQRKEIAKVTLKQQKQILNLYNDAIKELANSAAKSKDKSLQRRWQLDYLKELKRVRSELDKELQIQMNNSIKKSTKIGTKAEQQVMKDIFSKAGIDPGDHFTTMFSQVHDNVIKDILSGNLYKDNKTLSSRIWNYGNDFENDMQYTVNRAILEKKSAIELAKDLEQYVKDPARRDATWGKAYPHLRNKRVDYNAMRMARTTINHSYQTATIQASNMNPFVEGMEWESALIHGRTCELCMERHGQIFPKNNVPLDHPNGLCTMLPHILKSLDEVAAELRDWIDGQDNPILDDWYDKYGDYFSGIKNVVKFRNKGYNNIKDKEKPINYIDRRKLTVEEVRQEMDAIYQSDYSKILNDKDEENIYDYQIKTFTPYNDFLRGKRASLKEPLMEGLELLKATTSKVTIKEDMMLSRGTTINALEGIKWEDLEAGEVLTEKAFMSASAREETARNFAKKKKDRGVLIDIQVKKGNKAVFVDTAVDYNWESEFIFPPGTKLKVLDKWEDKGLKRIKGVIIDA